MHRVGYSRALERICARLDSQAEREVVAGAIRSLNKARAFRAGVRALIVETAEEGTAMAVTNVSDEDVALVTRDNVRTYDSLVMREYHARRKNAPKDVTNADVYASAVRSVANDLGIDAARFDREFRAMKGIITRDARAAKSNGKSEPAESADYRAMTADALAPLAPPAPKPDTSEYSSDSLVASLKGMKPGEMRLLVMKDRETADKAMRCISWVTVKLGWRKNGEKAVHKCHTLDAFHAGAQCALVRVDRLG